MGRIRSNIRDQRKNPLTRSHGERIAGQTGSVPDQGCVREFPRCRRTRPRERRARSGKLSSTSRIEVTIRSRELLSRQPECSAGPAGIRRFIRAVGPTVVFAPLLDGPQLNSRWAARYASVLADDPGSAVLTLTSYGMAQRSRPHGCDSSPVVALWKDPVRGLREIRLESGAQGVLLTLCGSRTTRRSADGRHPIDDATEYFDVAVHQVRAGSAGAAPSHSHAGSLQRRVPHRSPY